MAAKFDIDVDELTEVLGPAAVCVFGVGNRQRRDDGVGSMIAGRLANRLGQWAVDAGAVPENHLEKVARLGPKTVLLIDAVDFSGIPGEARLMEPNQIANPALSTHALSLRMTADYLRARIRADLILLAIQPVDLGRGEGLSAKVSHTARHLEGLLASFIRAERKSDL